MERPQDDGLKWFGEGFDGFPKRLPGDCVEYSIRIIDSKLPDTAIREKLSNVERTASRLSRELLKDYIWQRDIFTLNLKREDNFWILHGRTDFGDSVADEWLIVYLLRELSRLIDNAWIRVYDTDGEFLLIEAANALPRWLNPEVAQNRVWIHGGKLLIIPLHQSLTSQGRTSPITKPLSMIEATCFICRSPRKLTHSPLIEEEAFYRIRNHPGQIKDNLHHAPLYIPRRLAYVVHKNPSHVSAAIEAFYLRDPIAVRPLNTKDKSTLNFPPEDFVKTVVGFNKVGYAQLYSQDFTPSKLWEEWLHETNDAVTRKRWEVAMKLTCGFEMLVEDPQNQDKRAVREIKLLLEDLGSGEEQLPCDKEVESWVVQEDNEDWLDIDLESLEDELQGRKGNGKRGAKGGFGDEATQDNLRKMVQRFEDFLNNDESDDMDEDNDNEDEEDQTDEDEDREVSFDEEEFVKLMTEMMGLPPALGGETHQDRADTSEDVDDDDDGDDAEDIRTLSELMGLELKAAEALNLNIDPSGRSARTSGVKCSGEPVTTGKVKRNQANEAVGNVFEASEDEEKSDIDIDFELANDLLKNLQGLSVVNVAAGNTNGLK
ncbi:SGT1-domain-containing protein [Pseudovirgaria hyperparasitica]|uniref:SGT1-domain-containing protein n=1 Tax=Pseudovirgaria hyperparasitica TaxID=470096 RepID=A0A6A6WGS0_9PEZI|nr:SGT1-domain-containing protein [Pseudovirgaria hyperparasitica]KAF2760837.1 SGT1-domain-containing protein [Pseudovirgaria hyperparasitica]